MSGSNVGAVMSSGSASKSCAPAYTFAAPFINIAVTRTPVDKALYPQFIFIPFPAVDAVPSQVAAAAALAPSSVAILIHQSSSLARAAPDDARPFSLATEDMYCLVPSAKPIPIIASSVAVLILAAVVFSPLHKKITASGTPKLAISMS